MGPRHPRALDPPAGRADRQSAGADRGPPGVPAFADANLAFSVNISDAAAALPQRTLVDQTVVSPTRRGTTTFSRPDARTIFTAIKDALAIPDRPAADTFSPQAAT